MDFATLKNRVSERTPSTATFEAEYDVIIVGLGTAGADAALIAAQKGMRVLGVETTVGMGGISTLGGVTGPGWHGSRGGACEHFYDRVDEMNRAAPYAQKKNSAAVFTCFYDVMAEEVGLEVSYETVAVGVYLEGNRVVGLRLCRNGVCRDVGCRVVIDCTTDCVICRMAGASVDYGRAWDNEIMAMSKTILIETAGGGIRSYSAQIDAVANPTAEENTAQILRMSCNYPCLWSTTRPRVLASTPLMGMREWGHVVTDETLTFSDCLDRVRPRHPLFALIAPIDLVRMDHCYAFEDRSYQDFRVLCGMTHFGFGTVISYENLLPRGLEGILVAGKCLGVDHAAAGGIRMVGMMRKSAEAAATAASIAVQRGLPLRGISYGELRAALEKSGCCAFDWDRCVIDLSMPADADGMRADVRLPDAEEVVALLGTPIEQNDDVIGSISAHKAQPEDRAPLAFFAARQTHLLPPERRAAFLDRLADEMNRGGGCAGNYAIALGIAGDRRAVPPLLSILRHPGATNPDGIDPIVPGAYPNRIKAICLLGRFGATEALPPLLALLEDEAKTFVSDLPAHANFPSEARYVYEVLMYAVEAVLNIYSASPDAFDPATRRRLLDWCERPRVLTVRARINANEGLCAKLRRALEG